MCTKISGQPETLQLWQTTPPPLPSAPVGNSGGARHCRPEQSESASYIPPRWRTIETNEFEYHYYYSLCVQWNDVLFVYVLLAAATRKPFKSLTNEITTCHGLYFQTPYPAIPIIYMVYYTPLPGYATQRDIPHSDAVCFYTLSRRLSYLQELVYALYNIMAFCIERNGRTRFKAQDIKILCPCFFFFFCKRSSFDCWSPRGGANR